MMKQLCQVSPAPLSPLLSSPVMSVWETVMTVMDKSSWQPDIQLCVRMEAVTAVTINPLRHNHSNPNTPIQ